MLKNRKYIYILIGVLILCILVGGFYFKSKIKTLEKDNFELKTDIEKKDVKNSIDSVNVSIDTINDKIEKIDNEKNSFDNISIDSIERYLLSVKK